MDDKRTQCAGIRMVAQYNDRAVSFEESPITVDRAGSSTNEGIRMVSSFQERAEPNNREPSSRAKQFRIPGALWRASLVAVVAACGTFLGGAFTVAAAFLASFLIFVFADQQLSADRAKSP